MFHYKNITSKGGAAVLADATARPSDANAPVSPKPARSRRRRSRRGLWGLILLILLAGAGWYAWQHYTNPPVQTAPETATVAQGDIQQTVLANGILQANSLVSVGAQVSGVIEKLDVKVGDTVKQGDLIAEIDPSDQQN